MSTLPSLMHQWIISQLYELFGIPAKRNGLGSVAREEAHETSDVDLLVKITQGVSIFELVGLWLDLQDLLGCKVSLVEDGGLEDAFKQSIQQDMVWL